VRLVKVLERYRKRRNQKELAELAKRLRDFADDLENPQRATKKKAKE
jgi:hypothetical protein